MKKRNRYSATKKTVENLRVADAMLAEGKNMKDVLRRLEVSGAMLFRWRSQYGDTKSEGARRLKEMEDENRRLKQIITDQSLDIQMLNEIAKES
jgi:transposase-like protein